VEHLLVDDGANRLCDRMNLVDDRPQRGEIQRDRGEFDLHSTTQCFLEFVARVAR
jgi:hypothetical protein